MGMADLKKTCSKQYELAEFDVDDFIDDVDNYIHGRQSFIFPPQLTVVEESSRLTSLPVCKQVRKNATFSLNTECIAQLNSLSQAQAVNKSKLIRILINQFAQLSPSEQKKILMSLG
ncbi:RepA domain-containing protein [Catenovulum agarivorans DS-2]|uniref:RepA domain-containing protein n=1 Tax=Catenovulum agarivorans DS-2 TaxID=1328313 RepID=W7Q9N6_9ALTE|nr:hypothetical protein [Catenovulum agarivorans]EWH08686.1 RepA domain-containing protein [Catenovulum agarivorans DS-2]